MSRAHTQSTTSARLGFAVGLALLSAACKRASEAIEAGEPPPVAEQHPLDHVAPGELLVGSERAFGLVLPRDFVILSRLDGAILARGPGDAPNLARYLQARVRDGHAVIGSEHSRFDEVRVPADPTRPLRIHVDQLSPGSVSLRVEDLTPPLDPGGTVSERMARHGRKPDGTLVNPQKME